MVFSLRLPYFIPLIYERAVHTRNAMKENVELTGRVLYSVLQICFFDYLSWARRANIHTGSRFSGAHLLHVNDLLRWPFKSVGMI